MGGDSHGWSEHSCVHACKLTGPTLMCVILTVTYTVIKVSHCLSVLLVGLQSGGLLWMIFIIAMHYHQTAILRSTLAENCNVL